ncbi:hypothetical protein llap_13967 [Limosa lapponica baueri]|uniref:E3 ubiquitin-protein ligase KCMF1 n=1 Tax=Limosa lapponica baueri TaxID=1758121 RepID=A0A2I0TPJ1_LIMLA|nr:hypothetical protein llap_13967 [Limosa lapponica baueri]
MASFLSFPSYLALGDFKTEVKGPAREIQFLGIKWQDGHCQIPMDVINKIAAISPPTSKKEAQAFLGVVGFWRMHIPDYSLIVSPLYQVTWEKNDFKWGPGQRQAFKQIMQEIVHAVALGPVWVGQDVKNVLYTAAGENGPTWSLWQKAPGAIRGRPLGFWSWGYRGSKARYTLTQKDILAAYEGVRAASEVVGVSCDACLKGNFRGRRYKCLICYDYDLCATCYESGATTTRHTTDHPMQCILTRVDFDLYYGGEAFSVEQPQSFTCPYCGKMGYTETSLQEHVASEHAETSTEVICPICAALPGGDPNHVTDDFAAHLTLEHRAPRDLISFLNGVRHVRRMFHPGRGLGGPRARRSNMHFTSSSTGGLSSSQSSYSPSNRETMDPIAELLSQLSGVRLGATACTGSKTTTGDCTQCN